MTNTIDSTLKIFSVHGYGMHVHVLYTESGILQGDISDLIPGRHTVRVGYDILYRPGTFSYLLLSVFIKSNLEHAQPHRQKIMPA